MGLLEFLFERKNPGNVGRIHKNNKPTMYMKLPILIIRLIVTVIIVYGLFYITVFNNINLTNIAKFLFFLFIYCFISYKVAVQPDTSNVGWLGGLIDNPFRYTDDLNRMLVVLFVLLYPGRFISTTVIQTVLFIKGIIRK